MRHFRLLSGFSLIELLGVIAIISIVVGITFSSVNFPTSMTLTADGNIISNTIAQARQNSVLEDAFTAFVLQTGSGYGAYTSYCLMQLKRDQFSGNFSNSSWQQLTVRPDDTMTMNQPIRLRLVCGTWSSSQGAIAYQGKANGDGPENYYAVLFL